MSHRQCYQLSQDPDDIIPDPNPANPFNVMATPPVPSSQICIPVSVNPAIIVQTPANLIPPSCLTAMSIQTPTSDTTMSKCYNFLPFSCLLPCCCSTSPLLPLCSSTQGDCSLLTCLSVTLLFLDLPSLVSHFFTGLSSPLTISLAIVMCSQHST